MELLQEYKYILKKEGLTGIFMAKMLGIKYGSYKSMTKNSVNTVPKWVISFVIGYRLKESLELIRGNPK